MRGQPLALDEVITFAIFAALLVATPGPNGLLILATVPKRGIGAGFMCIAGFAAAFLLHGTFSVLGISIIITKSAELFTIIKSAGAVYLIWVGGKALRSAWAKTTNSQGDIDSPASNRSFVSGFFTNALNPKVSIFYLAAFPQFLPSGTSIGASLALVAVHIFVATTWFTAMVLLSAKAGVAIRSPKASRWIQAATGVAFVGFGLKLLSLKNNA